jgi:hypothetical protein
MTTVGNYSTPALTVPTFDSSTVASLVIVSPDTTLAPIAGTGETSTDGGHHWTADPYVLNVPGVWIERWTVTGTGAGEAEHSITVAPVQPSPSLSGSYASTKDYADYIGLADGAALPGNLALLLRRATREVNRALVTAIYKPTDDGFDGRPISESLRDMTCEQVSFHLARGEGEGMPSGFQSVAIGSVQLGRGYSSAGGESDTQRFSELAWQIAVDAGITGHAPKTQGPLFLGQIGAQ